MFAQHFKGQLSAYAHGELTPADTVRVAEHLRGCLRCRREYEEIKLGIRLAESLPPAVAPRAVWDNIEAALAKQQLAGSKRPRQQDSQIQRDASPRLPRFSAFSVFSARRRAAFACLLVALCVCVFVFVVYRRSTRGAWEVTSLEGSPVVDSARIGRKGSLGVGEWLETDAASRAEVRVADIGHVEVAPDTRVRLVTSRLTEHRMELERGRISARIWAPPRLFFVNTPSAVAEDLGCAYTLEVDERGRSLLHVTSGWVAMVLDGRESMVPAGAACVTEPGAGPGTPFFEDAPERLLDALSRFDFQGGGSRALDEVLASARPRDTLTLWHLLSRVGEEDRARVYERLAVYAAPPEGVTREGVLRLERPM
ncbi:MAG TPA: FecR domain-containing protein, partial [Pyrinomonadaceae bacterium]|nr:FecR domain-containing protein [Pyrinomonadaceae bacterium]